MPSSRTRRQLLQTAAIIGFGVVTLKLAGFSALAGAGLDGGPADGPAGPGQVRHTDAEWRRMLSPAQYDVLRQEGTEAPFSSPLDHLYAGGTYDCAGCAKPLYASDTKFDSGTGWPSFYRPLPGAVTRHGDGSLGMERTEIRCARCDGHLGHVFDDGPRPTGLRYCMNGVALNFHPAAGVQPPHGA